MQSIAGGGDAGRPLLSSRAADGRVSATQPLARPAAVLTYDFLQLVRLPGDWPAGCQRRRWRRRLVDGDRRFALMIRHDDDGGGGGGDGDEGNFASASRVGRSGQTRGRDGRREARSAVTSPPPRPRRSSSRGSRRSSGQQQQPATTAGHERNPESNGPPLVRGLARARLCTLRVCVSLPRLAASCRQPREPEQDFFSLFDRFFNIFFFLVSFFFK